MSAMATISDPPLTVAPPDFPRMTLAEENDVETIGLTREGSSDMVAIGTHAAQDIKAGTVVLRLQQPLLNIVMSPPLSILESMFQVLTPPTIQAYLEGSISG